MSLRGTARRDMDATIRFLRGRLDKIDEEMKTLIAKHPDWNVKAELLDSVPGVGPVLISSIVAELPELGNVEPQANRRSGWSRTFQQRQRPVAWSGERYGVVVPTCARFYTCPSWLGSVSTRQYGSSTSI